MDTIPQRRNLDHTPPGTGMFGLKVFLASLSVLFAASLASYILIRWVHQSKGLAYGSLHLPGLLWVSTAVMVASSFAIHAATRAIREDRRSAFRRDLLITALLGLVFLMIQVPSLYLVLRAHAQARTQNIFLYGLVMLLIALHALHVIGGLIPLGVTTARALRGQYDAANHDAVRYCAVYWHFLDVVWLVMFGVLFFTG